MRTCHRALLPATLLLFIALAVLPASAFYNPTTGRWLSRDPIEERGGLNLLSFVRQAPVSFVDPRGLELTDGGIQQVPLDVIRGIDLIQPSTAWGMTLHSPPRLSGEDKIPPSGQCYQCAEVQESVQINVFMRTLIPDGSGLNSQYTIGGLAAILGHEQKHRNIITDGYNAYLDPANESRAKQCGRVCRRKPGEAHSLLSQYLVNLRVVAIDNYSVYVGGQNAALDNIESRRSNWDFDGLLFNGIKERWTPNSPWSASWPACPVSDVNPE